MNNVTGIYGQLHKSYGPQGWWPLSKGRMQTKHHSGAPKNPHDKWEIITGSLLTQYICFNKVLGVVNI